MNIHTSEIQVFHDIEDSYQGLLSYNTMHSGRWGTNVSQEHTISIPGAKDAYSLDY
jgi:hypothetical protein